jgi:hypothetical protein
MPLVPNDHSNQMVLFINHQHHLMMLLCTDQNIHQRKFNHVQLHFLSTCYLYFFSDLYMNFNVGRQEVILYIIIQKQLVINSIKLNKKQFSLNISNNLLQSNTKKSGFSNMIAHSTVKNKELI